MMSSIDGVSLHANNFLPVKRITARNNISEKRILKIMKENSNSFNVPPKFNSKVLMKYGNYFHLLRSKSREGNKPVSSISV